MKTFGTIITAALLLMPWCIVPIFGQDNSSHGAKKITIIKRSVDAEGTETTETIVKKGKAAENFDVDKYLAENRNGKVKVEVHVDEGSDIQEDLNALKFQIGKKLHELKGLSIITTCNDNSAFLGVEQDSDEDLDVPGLTLQVVKGSAAAKAGLKTNDVILKLNDTPVNVWADLSKIIEQSKPGDKIRVAYTRNGAEATTEATLSKHSEVPCVSEEQGFLGVSPLDEDGDDEDKPGVAVNIVDESAAAKAGLQDGDVILKLNDDEIGDFEDISDVMTDSKPGDKIQVTYERTGKRNSVDVIAGEQKSWNTDDPGGLNELDKIQWTGEKGLQIDAREKDACLGVYTAAYTTNNQKGTRVDDFTEESPARDVQMAVGDVITAVNGTPVVSHDDLWNQIATYKPGDKVNVDFVREGELRKVKATLKVCKDNASQVIINRIGEEGDNQTRQFYTWNWGKNEEKNMRERHVIIIHRGEGDASKIDPPRAPKEASDRSLKLQAFRAFPNPTQGQVTVEFQGDPVATVVSLFDLAGRQLFREELNAFNGDYAQQFDLSEYAKGTIMIQVVQGDKVYTEQVIVN